MKGVEAEDLHAGDAMAEKHIGFCGIGEEEVLGVDGREIWLDNEQDDLLDMSDTSIFYNDFPLPLPDFPCMSSSSSSSSTPAPVKAMTCPTSSSASSSSSAASWAVLKSDAEEDVEKKQQGNNQDPLDAPPAALSSTASMEIVPDQGLDCMDMLETFGYMELLEGSEFIDPSSIFQNGSPFDDFQLGQEDEQQQQQHQHEHAKCKTPNQQAISAEAAQSNNTEEKEEEEEDPEKDGEGDDMASVFLEWLRSNRETVSAEDLRSVKIKKATIECAARRLGGGKEAMKQLLKLVLEWVQTNHLQKRRTAAQPPFPYQYQDHHPNFQNPNSFARESNPCFNSSQTQWVSHSPYDTTNVVVAPPPPPPPYPSPGVGYDHAFVNGGAGSNMINSYATPPDQFHMLDSAQTWPPSQFAMASHYAPFPDNNIQPQAFSGYGNQYPASFQYFHGNGGDQRVARLGSSATKEARKKRMARQRRLLSHHRHQNHNQNQHHLHQSGGSQQSQNARHGSSDSCTVAGAAVQPNGGNWVYWPSAAAAGIPPSMIQGIPAEAPALRPQLHSYHGRMASEHRRQVGH